MPLYIRDSEVDELAARLAALTGARTKTEAVRTALLEQIAAVKARQGLAPRIARLQAKARAEGLRADGQDDKDLMDGLSGGL